MALFKLMFGMKACCLFLTLVAVLFIPAVSHCNLSMFFVFLIFAIISYLLNNFVVTATIMEFLTQLLFI